MKSTIQLRLDTARVEQLDVSYCREFWTAALFNNGTWPAAMEWGYQCVRRTVVCGTWWPRGWFLSFPVLERELIEDAVARLNRETNTDPLPLAVCGGSLERARSARRVTA